MVNVGELSTRSVLRRDDSCNVGTFASSLSQFGKACLIQVGQNTLRAAHPFFTKALPAGFLTLRKSSSLMLDIAALSKSSSFM